MLVRKKHIFYIIFSSMMTVLLCLVVIIRLSTYGNVCLKDYIISASYYDVMLTYIIPMIIVTLHKNSYYLEESFIIRFPDRKKYNYFLLKKYFFNSIFSSVNFCLLFNFIIGFIVLHGNIDNWNESGSYASITYEPVLINISFICLIILFFMEIFFTLLISLMLITMASRIYKHMIVAFLADIAFNVVQSPLYYFNFIYKDTWVMNSIYYKGFEFSNYIKLILFFILVIFLHFIIWDRDFSIKEKDS